MLEGVAFGGWGSRFGVPGFWYRVSGLDLGLRVEDFGQRVHEYRVVSCRFRVLGLWFWV